LDRPETYRKKALQCLLAVERKACSPAHRPILVYPREPRGCGTFVLADNADAAFTGVDRGSEPAPAIPL
jgi:hypothetical protein